MQSPVRFILQRIIRAALTLWLVVSAVFVILRLSGDPTSLFLSDNAEPEQIAALRTQLGHILPNIASVVLVIVTIDLRRIILFETTLSFLGLGVQPPQASWGAMLGKGRELLNTAWWISVFPGTALMLTILAVSLIGDWLRDVLDPTLRNG